MRGVWTGGKTPPIKKAAPITSNHHQPTRAPWPKRDGEQKRAYPQNAEGKRHQEPVVAKLVFADHVARVEFRLKHVECCEECEEYDRQPKRQPRRSPPDHAVIHNFQFNTLLRMIHAPVPNSDITAAVGRVLAILLKGVTEFGSVSPA